MSVVSLSGVSKEFGQGGIVAIEGIDLEIGEREFVSLIGPSGCGKSTLLRIIGDLIQPSSGEVTVKGKTAHRARLGRDYGIVFQDAVLFDWRTVAKNISLPLGTAASGPSASRSCSSSSSSPASRATIPGSSRAACSSASRSPARSPSIPRSC
jgi:NitT/TauT family transport system ATP-binding protein